MSCQNCGGSLLVIDEATGHIICDTCSYEEQHCEVLNDGTDEEEIILKLHYYNIKCGD